MTTEQLIDEQIIKALECCTKHEEGACDKCPYYGVVDAVDGLSCSECLIDDAFCLINLKKAEIERLQQKYELSEAEREANVKGFAETLKTVRAEAIKEFAERAKMLKCHYSETEYTFDFDGVTVDDIDNLVKEMTEDEGE